MPLDSEAIEELKSLVAVSRKKPLNFGLCLGSKPEDTVLMLHRKKTPEMLGRLAKREGSGSKVAAGLMESSGKLVSFTCEEAPPAGTAKKAKLFFKTVLNLKLNVTLLDADGGVLESEMDEDESEDATADTAVAEDAAGAATAEDNPDAARWDAMRKAVEPRVLAALKSGTGDPSKLRAAWAMAVESADGWDHARAITIAERLSGLLPAEDLAETRADDGAGGWAAMKAEVEPLVLAAISNGTGDVSKLRAAWAMAVEAGDAGDEDKAIKVATRLKELLGRAAEPAQPAAQPEIPSNVVAYVKSRLGWNEARRKLRTELERLKGAILEASADDEDAAAVRASVDDIFGPLEGFDDRLETTLEDLVEAPEGTERDKLKAKAVSIIKEYAAELEKPFFAGVDQNPFTPVAVRATARDALGKVATALRG